MNDNCVSRKKRKICKKFCEKWEKKKGGKKNGLDTEFDHIPAHISSIQGNFNLTVILPVLFKWGGSKIMI